MSEKNLKDKDILIDDAKRVADEDLARVNGGAQVDPSGRPKYSAMKLADGGGNPNLAGGVQRHYCIKCGKDTAHHVYSGGRLVCEVCGTVPAL